MPDKIESINVFGSSDTTEGNNDVLKESKLTYDTKFKQLFTTRAFLTPILKNIIPEYKECTLEEIEGYITPRGDVEINPAVYSLEDSGKGNEMPASYDVLVDCALPNKKEVCVDLFFDLEMQRKNNPGYSVPKRGIYYCCRLISRQLNKLDDDKSYNRLKPVYSVWILINDIPEESRNSIYSVDLAGSFDSRALNSSARAAKLQSQIDLIHLRLVYLSKDFNVRAEQSNLIKYLQSVFANKVSDSGCNPYSNYSRKIEKEVNAMMSPADAIEAWAMERGREEGIGIGREEGTVKTLLKLGKTDNEIIHFLITEMDSSLTREEAVELLERCRKKNR